MEEVSEILTPKLGKSITVYWKLEYSRTAIFFYILLGNKIYHVMI